MIIGFVVVNPEVLVARRIESTGRLAPALEIIRWRLEQLRTETTIEADFWGVLPCDVALTRAVRLAKARSNRSQQNTGAEVETLVVSDTCEQRAVGARQSMAKVSQ
jgi:hypothetical protein